jgi:hypothetical protein
MRAFIDPIQPTPRGFRKAARLGACIEGQELAGRRCALGRPRKWLRTTRAARLQAYTEKRSRLRAALTQWAFCHVPVYTVSIATNFVRRPLSWMPSAFSRHRKLHLRIVWDMSRASSTRSQSPGRCQSARVCRQTGRVPARRARLLAPDQDQYACRACRSTRRRRWT